MLLDIGWPELLLIGAIALVVIGPKDLPRAMRVAGFWMRKARSLSREFHNSVDQMIREAELEEVRQELQKAGDFDIEQHIRNTIDPTGELAEGITPPHIPDHFEEGHFEELPAPAASEAAAEPPRALPAPEEKPLPEQPLLPFAEPQHAPIDEPALPFDDPQHAPSGGRGDERRADERWPGPDGAPPKP